GAEVVEIPFIEIRRPSSFKPLDATLKNILAYDWLILTSVNGVEALGERIRRLQVRKSHLAHLKIAAIGPATAHAVERLRLKVYIIPEEYVAESVVKALRNQVNGDRILLARAKVARDVIPRELRKLGARVDVVEAYETVMPRSSRPRLLALLRDPKRRPNVITFTSSSTVRNFVALLSAKSRRQERLGHAALLDGIKFASIGPVTSSTLREFGMTPHIEARKYTIPGLLEAIDRAYARKPANRVR
ncbi:MAG TPA: uroporphyrinogen-III synthase, partial [Terriglobales bacterium]|nr:uroporphyrinogen-III synthase [Terriglobales bacterium]